jgi:hypothetical protein
MAEPCFQRSFGPCQYGGSFALVVVKDHDSQMALYGCFLVSPSLKLLGATIGTPVNDDPNG